MKKKVYHWQPELSTAIIYWSCTFGILFFSLILTLEYTRPYRMSNIVLAIFFFFLLLGYNRYFFLQSDQLVIHTMLPIARKKITVATIEMIRVGPKSIEIYSSHFKEGSQLYMMTKKNKMAFIARIAEQKTFTGEIIKDDSLKVSQ